jgi:hypothetical protein
VDATILTQQFLTYINIIQLQSVVLHFDIPLKLKTAQSQLHFDSQLSFSLATQTPLTDLHSMFARILTRGVPIRGLLSQDLLLRRGCPRPSKKWNELPHQTLIDTTLGFELIDIFTLDILVMMKAPYIHSGHTPFLRKEQLLDFWTAAFAENCVMSRRTEYVS